MLTKTQLRIKITKYKSWALRAKLNGDVRTCRVFLVVAKNAQNKIGALNESI